MFSFPCIPFVCQQKNFSVIHLNPNFENPQRYYSVKTITGTRTGILFMFCCSLSSENEPQCLFGSWIYTRHTLSFFRRRLYTFTVLAFWFLMMFTSPTILWVLNGENCKSFTKGIGLRLSINWVYQSVSIPCKALASA